MSSRYEPVLHALEVEPRVARPGQTVRLIFRTRNVGPLPSPAGTVVFALPAGVEPLGDPEAALPPAAAGEPAVATICARIVPSFEDRTELPLQAVLVLDDARLPTNVCPLLIRSRAILDGSASGTFVEALDADTVRVRAVVSNEGDGPALRAHLRLPAPAGCRRLDGDGPATLDIERLYPGESVALALDARIEHAMSAVSADAGEVRCDNGTRCALPARSAISLPPALSVPVVTTDALRRRIEVAVELRNDGWVHARDVDVTVTLPPALRLDGSSVEIDGAPILAARPRRGPSSPVGRLKARGDTFVVTLAVVPARAVTQVRFAATHAGEFDGGTVRVQVEERTTEVDVSATPCRDVRIEPLVVPPAVIPGVASCAHVRLVNAGDRTEHVHVTLIRNGIAETDSPRCTVEAGSAVVVELPLTVAASEHDGTSLAFAVVVSDAAIGVELARAEFATTLRVPVVPIAAAVDDDDGAPLRAHPALHAALRAAEEIVAGTVVAVRLDADVEEALDRLVVRVPDVAGARYVPGSCSVGGCALIDGPAGSPLHGGGVVLRAIPAATRVTVCWSLLVDPTATEALAIGAELDAGDRCYELAPLTVCVRRPSPFAARPASLAYHVEACAVPQHLDSGIVARDDARDVARGDACDDERDDSFETARSGGAGDGRREGDRSGADDRGNADSHGGDRGFGLHDADPALPVMEPPSGDLVTPVAQVAQRAPRWDEIARLLQGVRSGGLVPHVLALRPFFPEALADPATPAQAAFDSAGHALRDVFDRLFVKLRIPGFAVAADDVEDARLRTALLALAEAEAIPASRAELAGVPLGAPVALRALVAAIPPPAGDTPAGRAAGAYLRALDAMLASYADLPIAVFDEALARGREDALDDARRELLIAIDEQLAPKAAVR
jgi:hypothetical protein